MRENPPVPVATSPAIAQLHNCAQGKLLKARPRILRKRPCRKSASAERQFWRLNAGEPHFSPVIQHKRVAIHHAGNAPLFTALKRTGRDRIRLPRSAPMATGFEASGTCIGRVAISGGRSRAGMHCKGEHQHRQKKDEEPGETPGPQTCQPGEPIDQACPSSCRISFARSAMIAASVRLRTPSACRIAFT